MNINIEYESAQKLYSPNILKYTKNHSPPDNKSSMNVGPVTLLFITINPAPADCGHTADPQKRYANTSFQRTN